MRSRAEEGINEGVADGEANNNEDNQREELTIEERPLCRLSDRRAEELIGTRNSPARSTDWNSQKRSTSCDASESRTRNGVLKTVSQTVCDLDWYNGPCSRSTYAPGNSG